MKTYQAFITELFDKPLEFDGPHEIEDQSYAYEFETSKGQNFEVNANIDKNGAWEFGFDSDSSSETKSGKGEEFQVFSTVVKILNDFIKREAPDHVFIEAVKSEPSRLRLFRRMVQKFVQRNPEYKFSERERGRYIRWDVIVKNKNISEDYKGEHQASGKEGAPLHDLTHNGVYPKDVYSSKGIQYYGDGGEFDRAAFAFVQAYHNNPNRKIKIYRAVPYQQTKEDLLAALQKAQALWLKRAKPSPDFESEFQKLGAKKYYEWLGTEEEKLKKSDKKVENISEINPGDWITIVRNYAVSHGRAHLKNKYRVLSKTVKAKEIWTGGDSILEWGYSP